MDTICALSSGALPAGVAVVRVSGPAAADAARAVAGILPPPRRARLSTFRNPDTGEAVDRGLALWFPGPASFTGEDCVEFHCHGGRAVVAALLTALARRPGVRLAEAGEFSRRAFENGRLDLTQAEGLSDLIRAETQAQRRQALAQAGGALSRRLSEWREALIGLRAEVEARLDFSDEGDVEDELGNDFWTRLRGLRDDMAALLAASAAAERVREGLRVAILGRPNAGKSTLLNALARREVAIVTDEPGTTRDVLEVVLDLGGFPVLLYDTAGLREADSRAEREGVRRAHATAEAADLVLTLHDPTAEEDGALLASALARHEAGRPVWWVETKADLALPCATSAASPVPAFRISALTGFGLDALEAALAKEAAGGAGAFEDAAVTRVRQRVLVESAHAVLAEALAGQREEVLAESLRAASAAIGRLTGQVGVEDVLNHLFSEFCIGK
jgi:tRNA modification GTPase